MDVHQPEPRRTTKARQRHQARQQRQEMATRRPTVESLTPRLPPAIAAKLPENTKARVTHGLLWLQDAAWHIRHSLKAMQVIAGLIALLFIFFVASHAIAGRIYPNVWSLGVPLGDLTTGEAQQTLSTLWQSGTQIKLVDGDRSWMVNPKDLGLGLDTTATVQNAHDVGMGGIPFGYTIMPVVSLDEFTAQNYLLNISDSVNINPYNAGYKWQGDQLDGVSGQNGRMLDIAKTLQVLKDNTAAVAASRQLTLVTDSLSPDVTNPAPYLDQAKALTSQPFQMVAYDPFTDEHLTFTTDRDTVTSWLEASPNGLTLRARLFQSFVDAQNNVLLGSTNTGVTATAEDRLRYIEATEAADQVRRAIAVGAHEVDLRIRYHSTTYDVEAGDTGYRIGRKTGIPFYLIDQANPNLNWDHLSVGDTINLPSRDLVLPMDPVPSKRIIVDLDNQTLTAYENGQQVFHWLISSGISSAPTYPGIFQVLSHNDTALGSSYNLCSSSGCGQWTMYWFMGIYEVTPGLMNGFHGAVLLPNGAYLGGGNVGAPYTYGCIMSENSNAQELYNWAQDGTVVEIISGEFQPQSDLGRAAEALAQAQ